jgi:hypothetical protein
MTTGAFVLFVLLCLTLTILSGKRRTSVMEGVPVAAPAEASETTETTDPALGVAPEEGDAVPVTDPVADEGADQPEPTGGGN